MRTIAAGQRFAVLRAAAEDMKSLLVILWPAGLQIRLQDILVTILGRIVENLACQAGRHELQIGEMTGIIVGILVAITVAKLLHQPGRSIPQIKGNRLGLSLFGYPKCLIDSHVG